MSKFKTFFICQNCGYNSPKWIGKCPSCNSWNSFIEEIIEKKKSIIEKNNIIKGTPKQIKDIIIDDFKRLILPFNEFNRVLGGGLVPGTIVLIGGEPGVGKSTLILQTALRINKKVVYVSGEESEGQIKIRADRVGIINENCLIYTETNIEKIIATIEFYKPDLVIIDSIQTIYYDELTSATGTITQIKESARQLQVFAKKNNTPVIIIGHINKQGDIAGPMVLEHLVDVVIQFEGDTNFFYRILRPKKNRFGSTFEIGVFEMKTEGLVEINDAGNILLSKQDKLLSGVAYGTLGQGARVLMLEVQALTSNAVFASPQRSATGFDSRRFQMLLAVIEKRLGLKLAQKDVFLNIAGGIKVNDPAVDLSVVASIVSSFLDKTIIENTCFIGEVGLSGIIKPVANIDKKISEVARLGFKNIFLAQTQKQIKADKQINLIKVSDINQFLSKLF